MPEPIAATERWTRSKGPPPAPAPPQSTSTTAASTSSTTSSNVFQSRTASNTPFRPRQTLPRRAPQQSRSHTNAISNPPSASSTTSVPPADQQKEDASNTVAPVFSPPARSGVQETDNDSERCPHPLHPAYAQTYQRNLCPLCITHKRIQVLKVAELAITNHHGRKPWLEHVRSLEGSDEYSKEAQAYKFWTGTYDAKNQHRHDNGEDVSLPRAKKLLLRQIEKLETQRDLERGWEERNPIGMRDQSDQDVLLDPDLGSATKALGYLDALYREGKLGRVEMHAAEFHRKRAREMEGFTKPGYPDPDDEGKSFILTPEQRDFVTTYIANQGDPPEYGPKWAPPLPKRRRLDSSVRVVIDTHTYVRREADVDLLFSSSRADFLQDTPSTPTTSGSVPRPGPGHMNPPPARPHDIEDLEMREKNTAKTREWVRSVPDPGYVRIDTSGYYKKGNLWDIYREAQRAEAEGSYPAVPRGSDQQTPGSGKLYEPDELDAEIPTESEIARAERQIQQIVVQQNAQQAVAGAHRSIAGAQQMIAENPVLPMTYETTAEGQLRAEFADQLRREAEAAVPRGSRARLRSHGGMASAFAIGEFVSDAALALLRRYGVL